MNDDLKSKALANLGWRLHGVGKNEEARRASEAALRINDKLEFAHLNLSLIHGTFRDEKKAIECARRAYELDPANPTIEMGLAFALLFGRKFQEGLKHFEARFAYKLQSFLQYPYPKWRGEEGKVIFLVADQGLGDTLSYARFVELACRRSRHIYATIQPELMRLFGDSFAHVPNITFLPSPCPFPAADHWSTFVSLPFALGLNDAEYRNQPHIKIKQYPLPAPWKVSDRKIHIGIAYQGSALNDINKHRSIGLDWFLELYRVPGIQLYSLQISDEHKWITEQGCSALIPDLKPYIRDVADCYSVLSHLDLVITIESFLGHVAGAIGMPCIIPYSYQGRDYRIGHTGEDVIWYPQHTVVSQGPDLNWAPVFERIVRILKRKVEALDAQRVGTKKVVAL